MAPDSLHTLYANQMAPHARFGYALYEPPLSKDLKPGAVGYFDASGNWNPILQLSDEKAVQSAGYVEVKEKLKHVRDENIAWGPRCSSGVRGAIVDLKASLNTLPAGIPASAAAVYRYQSKSSTGAILMTSPPVVHQRYLYESPFRQWVQENALRIIEKRPEVTQHGLWVVTSTYGTKQCSLNVWTGKQKETMIGFTVKDVSGAEAGPAAQWYEAVSDSDWSRYSAEGKNLRVVFIGGLRFRYNRLSKKTPLVEGNTTKTKWFRDDDVAEGPIIVPINEEEVWEISVEKIGEDDEHPSGADQKLDVDDDF